MTSHTLILYTHPQSRGRTARWMLEELGVPYDTHWLEYGTTMKAPEYLRINPMGKVPALQHNAAIVTENIAICAYLAQAFPEAKLTPDMGDDAAWADYLRWMFFMAGPVESAVGDKALGVDVPQDKQAMIGYGTFSAPFAALESALKDKAFIAGNRFSAADLVIAGYLSFFMAFGIVGETPVFRAYVDRHLSRDAFKRADAIDNEKASA